MSIQRALVLIVVYVVLGALVFQALRATGLWTESLSAMEPSAAMFTLIAFGTLLTGGVVVWVGSLRAVGGTWRTLGWHTDRLGRSLLLGILGAFAAVCVPIGLQLAYGATITEVMEDLAQVTVAQRLVFLCIGMHAGFLEESMFRGNLQPSLQARLGRPAGLALTAAIFAIYHMSLAPLALASKFTLGLIFGAVRGRNGSLVAPAVAHALVWTVAGLL